MKNPEKKKHWLWDPPGLYWACGLGVGLLWLGEWYFHGLTWRPLVLGLATGALFTAWAIEITGNKMTGSGDK